MYWIDGRKAPDAGHARGLAWLDLVAMVLDIISMVSTLGARCSVKLPFGSMRGFC